MSEEGVAVCLIPRIWNVLLPDLCNHHRVIPTLTCIDGNCPFHFDMDRLVQLQVAMEEGRVLWWCSFCHAPVGTGFGWLVC